MANTPIHSMTDLWNSGVTTYYAIKMDVTNTSSAANSKLFAMQISSANVFDIDKSGDVTLTSVDAGAAAGPNLTLYRNSATPAASDIIGKVLFQGEDSAGNTQDYADIFATITDPTTTSEDASLTFRNSVAGTMTTQAVITATGWNSMNIGATTPGTGAFTTLSATGTASLVAANLTGNLSISKVTPAITLTSTGTGSDSTISEHTSGLTYAADVNNEVASSFHIFTVDGTQKFAVGASTVGLSAGVSLVASAGGSLTGTWTDLGTVSTVVINGGTITGITDLAVADGGTGASTAANARTNLGLAIGTDVQAYDSGLAALAAFNTNGILCQTANNTFAGRTLTGTANEITVTNGDGVSGAPTIAIPSAVTFTGKTITGGTYSGAALNGTLGATTPSSVAATTIDASSTLTAVDSITLTSTDAGATDAPLIIMDRNSASPAIGDRLGSIQWKGRSSTGVTRTYVDMLVAVIDPTNTSEDANFTIRNMVNGTITTQCTITATGWNSMNIGATTPGTGAFTTLNANGGGALTGTWSNMGSVTTIDINGGTIDGTAIGGATPAAGAFTTISATGDISQNKATPTFTQTDTGSGSVNFIQSGATLLFSVDGANAVASSAVQFNVDGAARMSVTATSLRMLNGITLRFATYTVATLPAGSTGDTVFATDCRVFNGAGTQEGAGLGTGGLVTYNGAAWKIEGTNVTAVA